MAPELRSLAARGADEVLVSGTAAEARQLGNALFHGSGESHAPPSEARPLTVPRCPPLLAR